MKSCKGYTVREFGREVGPEKVKYIIAVDGKFSDVKKKFFFLLNTDTV